MPCVYESRLGPDDAAKKEACRRFAEGTYEPGIGPGGGFFTLPNTILHEGPRQQARVPERAAADRPGEDPPGHPPPDDRGGDARPDVLGGHDLPGGPGPREHLEPRPPERGLHRRRPRGTGHRHPPALHPRGGAEPRSTPRPQPGGLQRGPVAQRAHRGDHRRGRCRATTCPRPTRWWPDCATTPGRASRRAGLERGAMEISERRLREVFLPPWVAGIRDAGALGVMATYPAIDGVPGPRLGTDPDRDPARRAGLRGTGPERGRRARHAPLRGPRPGDEGGGRARPEGRGGRGHLLRRRPTWARWPRPSTTALVPMALVDRAVRRVLRAEAATRPLRERPASIRSGRCGSPTPRRARTSPCRRPGRASCCSRTRAASFPCGRTWARSPSIGPNADHARNQLGDYTASTRPPGRDHRPRGRPRHRLARHAGDPRQGLRRDRRRDGRDRRGRGGGAGRRRGDRGRRRERVAGAGEEGHERRGLRRGHARADRPAAGAGAGRPRDRARRRSSC